VAQLLFFPLAVFWPSAVIFSIFAVLFSALFSWLLSRIITVVSPEFFYKSNGLKIILVFSTLTGLLQTFLFFAV
jgi:hypothetical protein